MDFYLDPTIVEEKDAVRIRSILSEALAAIDNRKASLP
jgi:adenylate cyclase